MQQLDILLLKTPKHPSGPESDVKVTVLKLNRCKSSNQRIDILPASAWRASGFAAPSKPNPSRWPSCGWPTLKKRMEARAKHHGGLSGPSEL